MTKLDKVAHAICPKVKPWLDSASAEPHPCHACKDRMTAYGKATPLCLKVARAIAKTALAEITRLAR